MKNCQKLHEKARNKFWHYVFVVGGSVMFLTPTLKYNFLVFYLVCLGWNWIVFNSILQASRTSGRALPKTSVFSRRTRSISCWENGARRWKELPPVQASLQQWRSPGVFEKLGQNHFQEHEDESHRRRRLACKRFFIWKYRTRWHKTAD